MIRRRWWVRSVTVLACGAVIAGCGLDVRRGETSGDLGGELGLDSEPGEMGTGGSVASDAAAVDSVVMIGDSITKGSRTALVDDFGRIGFDDVLIDAENGKRMVVSAEGNPSGAAVASFLAGEDEPGGTEHADELWVVALGTNDVGNYSRPEEIAAAINEVLAAVPDESPLVWVDVHHPRRAEETAQFNAILEERVSRRGNAVVAPWSFFAPGEGVISADDVHPTTEGTEVFAFVVADTVRAFLDR